MNNGAQKRKSEQERKPASNLDPIELDLELQALSSSADKRRKYTVKTNLINELAIDPHNPKYNHIAIPEMNFKSSIAELEKKRNDLENKMEKSRSNDKLRQELYDLDRQLKIQRNYSLLRSTDKDAIIPDTKDDAQITVSTPERVVELLEEDLVLLEGTVPSPLITIDKVSEIMESDLKPFTFTTSDMQAIFEKNWRELTQSSSTYTPLKSLQNARVNPGSSQTESVESDAGFVYKSDFLSALF